MAVDLRLSDSSIIFISSRTGESKNYESWEEFAASRAGLRIVPHTLNLDAGGTSRHGTRNANLTPEFRMRFFTHLRNFCLFFKLKLGVDYNGDVRLRHTQERLCGRSDLA